MGTNATCASGHGRRVKLRLLDTVAAPTETVTALRTKAQPVAPQPGELRPTAGVRTALVLFRQGQRFQGFSGLLFRRELRACR
jgi:hypothetical protein